MPRNPKTRNSASAHERQRLGGRMAMLEWGGEVHECLIVKIHKNGKATIAHVRDEKIVESFCAIAELKFNPSNELAMAAPNSKMTTNQNDKNL